VPRQHHFADRQRARLARIFGIERSWPAIEAAPGQHQPGLAEGVEVGQRLLRAPGVGGGGALWLSPQGDCIAQRRQLRQFAAFVEARQQFGGRYQRRAVVLGELLDQRFRIEGVMQHQRTAVQKPSEQ